MDLTDEQRQKLSQMERILGYRFRNTRYILSAITHPSATEGKAVRFSYERLEFLGDSILGAIVAYAAFHKYPDLDEGGLTRIKVALVSGSSLAAVAESLGFAELIVFGSSETGTGHRGMHSALENVYEAVVAALYLDGGREVAERFVTDTLIPRMDISMAREPENPKSALQEKLQEDGITPTYELVDTQGPPHDRTFVAEVFAGETGLARGTGRTKKEAESQAAKSALARLGEFLGALAGTDEQKAAAKEQKAASKAQKAAAKAERQAQRKADAAERKAAKGAAADKVQ
ncbi:MAG: ribonuclease III [Eggerthellaceae bacterium]|jgi:ribonuclease-3|nr:ribonuclease III [Eggerthellaceae bacterium]